MKYSLVQLYLNSAKHLFIIKNKKNWFGFYAIKKCLMGGKFRGIDEEIKANVSVISESDSIQELIEAAALYTISE